MLFRKKPLRVYLKGLPKHLGVIAIPSDFEDMGAHIKKIQRIIETIVRLRIPIVSFHIMPYGADVSTFSDYVNVLMHQLCNWQAPHDHQMKVNVIGQWYELPSRAVEPIKRVIEETQDYDRHFINFFVHYSGQEEIVRALQVLGKKMELRRLDAEQITAGVVKEHLQTSYFIPPDVVILTGERLHGLMLWDSGDAYLYPSGKTWETLSLTDVVKGIRAYQKRPKTTQLL